MLTKYSNYYVYELIISVQHHTHFRNFIGYVKQLLSFPGRISNDVPEYCALTEWVSAILDIDIEYLNQNEYPELFKKSSLMNLQYDLVTYKVTMKTLLPLKDTFLTKLLGTLETTRTLSLNFIDRWSELYNQTIQVENNRDVGTRREYYYTYHGVTNILSAYCPTTVAYGCWNRPRFVDYLFPIFVETLGKDFIHDVRKTALARNIENNLITIHKFDLIEIYLFDKNIEQQLTDLIKRDDSDSNQAYSYYHVDSELLSYVYNYSTSYSNDSMKYFITNFVQYHRNNIIGYDGCINPNTSRFIPTYFKVKNSIFENTQTLKYDTRAKLRYMYIACTNYDDFMKEANQM